MDGYISEQGHRLTPFQTQQAASQKGATLWFRKHPYSRLYIILLRSLIYVSFCIFLYNIISC